MKFNLFLFFCLTSNIQALIEKMVWNPTGNRPFSEPMFVCLTDAYIRYYVPRITVTMKENIEIPSNGYVVMYFHSGFMHKVLLIYHQFLIMY